MITRIRKVSRLPVYRIWVEEGDRKYSAYLGKLEDLLRHVEGDAEAYSPQEGDDRRVFKLAETLGQLYVAHGPLKREREQVMFYSRMPLSLQERLRGLSMKTSLPISKLVEVALRYFLQLSPKEMERAIIQAHFLGLLEEGETNEEAGG